MGFTKELHAIQRDVVRWNSRRKLNDWDTVGTLADLEKEMREYPSIIGRVMSFYYKCRRGVRMVRYFPYEVRCFIHRGRHGWAEPDAWSVDTYFVDLMIPLLEYYAENTISYPDGETFEEHVNKVRQIVYGLRQYQLLHEYDHNLKPEDYNTATDEAMKHLADACKLLGEELPGIWI